MRRDFQCSNYNKKVSLRVSVVLALGALTASADTVIFQNGDRLTGDIQRLDNQQLILKTGHAGTVTIDWKTVARLSSERLFRIETESGKRIEGALRDSVATVQVITPEGDIVVPAASVISLGPPPAPGRETIMSKLHGAGDLGFNLTRGNNRFDQASLAASAEYRAPGYKVRGDLTSLFSEQSGAAPTSKHLGSLRWDQYISPTAFTFTLGSVERDDRQNLRLRLNLGGGLGWKIISTRRSELSILGGATFVQERFAGQAADDPDKRGASGEGLAGLSLDKARFRRVQFLSKLSVYPNLVDQGRYRLTFDGGIRVPLVSRLTWNLSVFDRFDSRPPRDVQRNDYGLINGFGLTF